MEARNCSSRSTQHLDKTCCFFPLCGRLMGHLPVCRWLCVVASTIKCRASIVTKVWDDETTNTLLVCIVTETIARLKKSDPARGDWYMQGKEMNIWVDASSLVNRNLIGKERSCNQGRVLIVAN